MSTIDEISARLELARRVGELVAGYIRDRWTPGGCRFDNKADGSPVTAIDRGAEEMIRSMLAREVSQDAVLGEEFGASGNEHSAFRWVLDPIDGTKAFVAGVPMFGSLIGVQERAGGGWRSVIGVLTLPALDQALWAAPGRGCWWRCGQEPARRVQASGTARLSEALVCFSEGRTLVRMGPSGIIDRFATRAKQVRGWGDCYGHAMVVSGRADAMIDGPMAIWDVCALEPLYAEAGATLTDGACGPVGDGARGAIGACTAIHAEVARVLVDAEGEAA